MKLLEVKVSLLKDNPDNMNEMSDYKFNRLVENIRENGFIEPPAVVELSNGDYEIFSGHHRVMAGKLLGFTKIPCNVYSEEEMPKKKRDLQLMRMNVIKGKISPTKFISYYEKMSKEYGAEIAGAMFGLEESELEKLLKDTRSSLPDEMKERFDEVKKEIKTIEDLSRILNHLFSEYGETLDYNFMIFDYGGKKNLWIRCDKELWEMMDKVQEKCNESKEDIVGKLKIAIRNSKILEN